MNTNHEPMVFRPWTLSCAAFVLIATACGGSGDPAGTAGADGEGGDGNGGSGNGSSGAGGPGGGTSACEEVVDSATVGSGMALTPHVVATEDGFAIASVRGGEVWLDMIDTDGVAVSSTQISNAAAIEPRLPSVYPVDGGLLAMWAEGSKVLSRAISAAGQPAGSPAVVATTTSTEPRPMGAPFNNVLAAAWMEGATSSTVAIVDGSSIMDESTMTGWFPAVTTRGEDIGIAWSNGPMDGPLSVATFDSIATPITVTGSAALIKDITASDDAFFVAWEEVGAGTEQVPVVKITDDVVADAHAAPTDSSANWPTVAWTGDRLAVAYYQYREGPSDVYVSFFDGDLNPVDGEILLAEAAKFPSAAFGHGLIAIAYSINDGPLQVSMVSCP
jgi:hypothetical protein